MSCPDVKLADDAFFTKSIVETFEEISCAKGIRVVSNHYGSLAKLSASAGDYFFSFANASTGKAISFRLIPMAWCIYILSHS